MYQAEGVKQGETRTDQISTETIREYVKGKVKADVESKSTIRVFKLVTDA